MKYKLIFFFLLFSLFSCKTNINEQISDLILENIHSSYPTENVVILMDSDCFSCFYEVLNNLEKTNSIGLFFSSSPVEFKKSLTNLNPELNWIELKNTELLHLISSKNKGFKGPYKFKYIKDIYENQSLSKK
jgi:hypothetical protein|tara:strand:+ start:763 stop:1158 length:396 start_codon:yes stop_codon:yes gene_type:complete